MPSSVGLLLLRTLALMLWMALVTGGARAAVSDHVLLVDIDGAISVATAGQVEHAVDAAKREKAAALVIRLNTPGGLVSATRDIIRTMVTAPVPIIVYVAPGGARAASAGTFIVYASNLAAMAPGTNLGAATPIEIGGLPGAPRPKEEEKGKGTETTSERKAINDVAAFLRSLAQLRGRDLDFAERAVREAATLTAQEARRQGVIEIVAETIPDLLAQADGRRVVVAGEARVLSTRDARLTEVESDWRTKLLAIIADPNIAFILLLVGIYGLLFEFWSPGAFLPGVLGGISLLLALIALSVLPVQYGALALLLLGIAMMVAEVFTPSGALGVGGVAAFLVGAFFLYNPEGSTISFGVATPIIFGAAATCAALTFAIVGMVVRARRRPAATGAEQMIAAKGTVVEWEAGAGRIRVHGEVWSALGPKELKVGDAVRVKRREGLTLFVEPA